MTDTPSEKRRWRLWITLSELVGVLALVIAGLNYWDSHREHAVDARRADAADHAAAARSAFIMTAEMQQDGARLALKPLNGGQAIQSQRYTFPKAVLDHPVEVSAAPPQIDLEWIAAGLQREVAAARKAGAPADGESSLLVGVQTRYVEDGAVRSDRSSYRLGYAWRHRLFGAPRLALQGVSVER